MSVDYVDKIRTPLKGILYCSEVVRSTSIDVVLTAINSEGGQRVDINALFTDMGIYVW